MSTIQVTLCYPVLPQLENDMTKGNGTKYVSFNCPADLHKRLQAERANNRGAYDQMPTVTTILLHALTEYLDRQDKKRQILGD